jgi:hypothetical protein
MSDSAVYKQMPTSWFANLAIVPMKKQRSERLRCRPDPPMSNTGIAFGGKSDGELSPKRRPSHRPADKKGNVPRL